jgi:predicted ABC-type ATPase
MPADGSALDLPAMATNVGVQTTAPKDYTLPDIVIIGGPNGAGKTTAAQQLMPKDLELREFLNADEVARGLSPFNAEHMAIMAGRSHLPLLRRCRADGWRITLLFLYLASPDAALQRVARRVRQGGHNIPPMR